MYIMQPHEQFSKILEICKSFMPGAYIRNVVQPAMASQ